MVTLSSFFLVDFIESIQRTNETSLDYEFRRAILLILDHLVLPSEFQEFEADAQAFWLTNYPFAYSNSYGTELDALFAKYSKEEFPSDYSNRIAGCLWPVIVPREWTDDEISWNGIDFFLYSLEDDGIRDDLSDPPGVSLFLLLKLKPQSEWALQHSNCPVCHLALEESNESANIDSAVKAFFIDDSLSNADSHEYTEPQAIFTVSNRHVKDISRLSRTSSLYRVIPESGYILFNYYSAVDSLVPANSFRIKTFPVDTDVKVSRFFHRRKPVEALVFLEDLSSLKDFEALAFRLETRGLTQVMKKFELLGPGVFVASGIAKRSNILSKSSSRVDIFVDSEGCAQIIYVTVTSLQA